MAAKHAVKHVIPFTLVKETKGTFRFQADKDDAVVTTVYVQKEAFPSGTTGADVPFLSVTVETV